MKPSTVVLVVLGVAGAGAAAYFLVRRQKSVPPAAPTQSAPGVFSTAEAVASGVTHIPLGAIGHAAQSAPLWLKVGVLPIGATALAQQAISHPVQTVKTVATAPIKAVSALGHAIGSLL